MGKKNRIGQVTQQLIQSRIAEVATVKNRQKHQQEKHSGPIEAQPESPPPNASTSTGNITKTTKQNGQHRPKVFPILVAFP